MHTYIIGPIRFFFHFFNLYGLDHCKIKISTIDFDQANERHVETKNYKIL